MTDSEFSHLLLDSSAVPNSEELKVIHASKQSHEQKYAALQEEISALTKKAQLASKELSQVGRQINAHANLVSPLRKLPPEILRAIFSHAAPSTPIGINSMTLAPPWTLMRVCKRWRDICLAYGGELWSRIYIDCKISAPELPKLPVAPPPFQLPFPFREDAEARPPPPSAAIRRAVSLLELQLRRSQNAALCVIISSDPRATYAQPYLRTLLPHMERCAYLKAPAHILAHTPLPQTCSRLTCVEIDYSKDLPGNEENPEADEFLKEETEELMGKLSAQPNLTAFTAYMKQLEYAVTTPLPKLWRPHLLTKLSLDMEGIGRELGRTPQMISMLTSLTELDMIDRAVYTDEELRDTRPRKSQKTPRATLDKLTKLSVGGTKLISFVLKTLSTPSLTHLTYMGIIVDHKPMVNFLAASSCDLQYFKIHAESPPAKICDFLSKFSDRLEALKSLAIYGQETGKSVLGPPPPPLGSGDVVISLLMRKHAADGSLTDVFPRITYLALGNLSVSISNVLDMIDSRRKPSAEPSTHTHQRLLFCNLTALATQHRWLTDRELDERMTQLARSRISSSQRDSHRADRMLWDLDGDFSDGFMRGVPKAEVQSYLNPLLDWKDGLKKEPEQLERTRQLLKEGLELWL